MVAGAASEQWAGLLYKDGQINNLKLPKVLKPKFEEMQKMIKMFSKGGISKMMRGLAGKFPGMN